MDREGNAMFATTSAWLAIGAGVLIVALILLRLGQFEFATVGPAVGSVLLLLGAVRTLRAQTGGLRLLCGAWGFACGMAWYAPSYDIPSIVPGMLAVSGPVLVSAVGLALVVLHQENKKIA
jgi:hypothetical protein